jgi:hypothetical protein
METRPESTGGRQDSALYDSIYPATKSDGSDDCWPALLVADLCKPPSGATNLMLLQILASCERGVRREVSALAYNTVAVSQTGQQRGLLSSQPDFIWELLANLLPAT